MNTYHVQSEKACMHVGADEFCVDENNNLCFYVDDELVGMSNWGEWVHVMKMPVETIFKDDDLKDIM